MASIPVEPGGHRDGVFGLARHDGCLLMVRNPRVTGGGVRSWWDLPGGAVRAGEALPEALRREWGEETGLDVEVGDLFLVADGAKRRPAGPVLYTWRAFFFHVRSRGEPAPGEGIDAVEWVPEAEVEGRLEAPYHGALRAWLSGVRNRYVPIDWQEPAPASRADGAGPRDLLLIAAAAAAGDADLLAAQVTRARAAGIGVARIEETLLQIVPYAGYPRAIRAFGIARPLLGDRGAGPATGDAMPSGWDVFTEVYGETAASVREGLGALHPVLRDWTLDHAYGQVLARRPVLSLLERELLAVSILTAMGGLEDPLLGHMRAVLRLGGSVADVAAAVQVVPASLGEHRRDAARRLLSRL